MQSWQDDMQTLPKTTHDTNSLQLVKCERCHWFDSYVCISLVCILQRWLSWRTSGLFSLSNAVLRRTPFWCSCLSALSLAKAVFHRSCHRVGREENIYMFWKAAPGCWPRCCRITCHFHLSLTSAVESQGIDLCLHEAFEKSDTQQLLIKFLFFLVNFW